MGEGAKARAREVLVVEDDANAAHVLGRMLAPEFRSRRVATVDAAIAVITDPSADLCLALIDIALGRNPCGGLDVLDVLADRRADVPCAIVSAWSEPHMMLRAARRGALYIPKPFKVDALSPLLMRARLGAGRDVTLAARADQQMGRWKLSPMQRTVLASLVARRTREQIATDLGISESTLSKHVSTAIAKAADTDGAPYEDAKDLVIALLSEPTSAPKR